MEATLAPARRWIVLLPFALITIIPAACGDVRGSIGDGGGGTAASGTSLDLGVDTAEDTPPPAVEPIRRAPISPLPAGSYRTTLGAPLTFTVDDQWDLEAMNDDGGGLLFGSYTPLDVSAPRVEWLDLDASGARVVPAAQRLTRGFFPPEFAATWDPLPDDLATWFATASGFEVGPAEPAVLGEAIGVSFTFAVGDVPDDSEVCLLWPCLRLLGGADWAWFALDGDLGRMWIVEYAGTTLLIQVRSQPADAALAVPAGSQVVNSMRFGEGA